MQTENTLVRSGRLAAFALLVAMGLALFGLTAVAQASGGDDDFRVYGRVNAMPDNGLIGAWVISGTAYVTTATTNFEQENGPFAVGTCVKANLAAADSTEIVKLQTEPDGDCDGQGGGDDGGDHGAEVRGFVDQMPQDGLIGAWVISGTTYTTDATTEFKQEYGPFAAGVCVKLHLVAGSTSAVRELETEREHYCINAGDDNGDDHGDDHGDDSHHDGDFFGAVQVVPPGFPTTMTGAWRIANVDVVADERTEFKQENGPLGVDAYVKVEFVIEADGSFRATEIKTAIADGNDDGGEDDGSPVENGTAFGVIDALPAQGLLGGWIISGVAYSVTAQTQLDDEGVFAVGVRVKVEFRLDAQGQRVAQEIEITADDGNVDEPAHSKLVGYVEQMPTNTFVGDWTIGGVAFVADAQTRFDEEDGLLVVGALVEAEYSTTAAGVHVLHKVETRVPPGAGDDDHVGEVEQTGMLRDAAAVHAVWRIGGQDYNVTPATQVSNNLGVASTVIVNSFVDRSGARVATRINSFVLASKVFLPLAAR
jgi:hypothetical protein